MGLWHGASWTFVIFGLFHGAILVLENVTEKYRERFFEWSRINRSEKIKNTLGWITTLALLVFSLFFFRAGSLQNSILLISSAFDFSGFTQTAIHLLKNNEVMFGMLMVIALLLAEYLHEKYNLVRFIAAKPLLIRWSVYAGFVMFILFFGMLYKQKFIYFQF